MLRVLFSPALTSLKFFRLGTPSLLFSPEGLLLRNCSTSAEFEPTNLGSRGALITPDLSPLHIYSPDEISQVLCCFLILDFIVFVKSPKMMLTNRNSITCSTILPAISSLQRTGSLTLVIAFIL